jgi:NADPH:quinone reductase-like Zn-dependent oxidoreductase
MNAIRLYGHQGLEQFIYENAPVPRPTSGEALVRVHAAGVIRAELSWVPTWNTPVGTPRALPIIPGHEFSGEIAALGMETTDFRVGDSVYGLIDWYCDGAQAEYCVARVADIAAKPGGIDHVSAAATPISALTAWQGLIERGSIESGQRVLIHGAAGGVGAFAVQIARWRDAKVTATASSSNLDFVRSLGATEVIDHDDIPFEEVARDMDLVFDTVGGATFQRSWRVLKPGGRLVTIVSGKNSNDERTRAAFFIVEPNRSQLETITRLIDSGAISPIVGCVFPLAEARLAYQHRPIRGKVVLQVIAGK